MCATDLTIAEIDAWEALDSRGLPTVAARVTLAGGAQGRAVVPAGASTGRHEAREWRDGGERFGGRGVRGAVEMIQTHVRPALTGADATNQTWVDARLSTIPAPPNRGFMGSNTTLAVSVATARAAAAGLGISLWAHVADDPTATPLLPMPMVQILAGGVHAGGMLDIQDVLAVPLGATTFGEAMEMAWRVRTATAAAARALGHDVSLVGDEGGLAISYRTNRAAVEAVAQAIDGVGLRGRVLVAIDVAAGQLVDADGQYRLRREGRTLHRDEWITELATWVRELPLWSIEDPVDEDDWDGWQFARTELRVPQLVGDDLFATDIRRVERGIRDAAATGVLVKPNQRGTLSEAGVVVGRARDAGLASILSARSGESEDDWLADLAVGWRTGQMKVGSLARSERTAKWNRLLELEATAADAILAHP